MSWLLTTGKWKCGSAVDTTSKNIYLMTSLLNSSSDKDVLHNGAQGVEGIYWEGTEAGLMGIPLFPGLIYATDGSQEVGNMGAAKASTGTKAKREAAAKWAGTKKTHFPTERNMQWHASPSRMR